MNVDPNDPAARTLTVATTRARSGFDQWSAWAAHVCGNVKEGTKLVCLRKAGHVSKKHRNGREEWK